MNLLIREGSNKTVLIIYASLNKWYVQFSFTEQKEGIHDDRFTDTACLVLLVLILKI